MSRPLRTFLLVAVAAALAGLGLALWRSADPTYTIQEWVNRDRFSKYDTLILDVGRKYDVDPMLIKAIVWRESKFHADMVGTSGERGLMQVGEPAARDWARIRKIETFAPTDLFDPKVNLEVGVWYLAKAAEHWKDKDDPIPFTLAEYNAGKKRVDRWIKESGKTNDATAADLMQWVDFPSTKKYVEDIVARRKTYEQRGRL